LPILQVREWRVKILTLNQPPNRGNRRPQSMKQLPPSKRRKLLSALKKYRKKYLVGKYSDLDESATRLMVNSFLTDILGFASLDEIKTEYMIRGTYADYIAQIGGVRYFIVEVKAMSIVLSDKHLRQTQNYAANEGIDWALLTNGKCFNFYKILFNKPIESKCVFSFDLSDDKILDRASDSFQFLTRTLAGKRGLESLWHRFIALEPSRISKLLFSKQVINYLRRTLKKSARVKITEDEIRGIISTIIEEPFEKVNAPHTRKKRRRRRLAISTKPTSPSIPTQ